MTALWIALAALAGAALGVALCSVCLRAYVREHPVVAFAFYLAQHPEKVTDLRHALALKAEFAHIRTQATRAYLNHTVTPHSGSPLRGARPTGVWVDELVGDDWLTAAMRQAAPEYLRHRGDVR